MTVNVTAQREAWLAGLAAAFQPVLEDRAALTFPPYRVTCGFPSKGGEMGRKTRVRGQCWAAIASEDRHAEIFVSPVEDDAATIAAILAHEMIHAALPQAGHKGPFQSAARAIGHKAPFTSSEPTPEFMAWAGPLIDAAGPYPHKRLNAFAAVGARKKQKARLLKAECEACGYTVRVTRTWVVQAGPPHCPVDGPMTVDLGDEDGEEGGEGDDDA